MSNDIHPYTTQRQSTTVVHSKELALDEVEFELLFEGAQAMRDYYRCQAEFVVLVIGRLGLRRGELAHLTADWVNWQKEMIEIPRQQDCTKGKDGGICGYCRKLAKQRAEWADSLPLAQARDWQWLSKTDAAAREIYFGFSPRVKLWIERFVDRYGEWEWSVQTVNRRVERAAEHAERLSPADVGPHGLRATAATWHAGRGLEAHALCQLMGWANLGVAECYLSRSGENTARQLDAIHR